MTHRNTETTTPATTRRERKLAAAEVVS